jgi:gliding motility-associated-like protein
LINSTTNADKFTWNPVQFLDDSLIKNPKIKPDSNIIYSVKAENFLTKCYIYDTLAININIPIAKFSANPTFGHSPLSVMFNNSSLPLNINSFWTFGNSETSNLFNPKTIFTKAGKYNVKLLVIDSIGCKDSVFEEINVNDGLVINIPNVFTPNSDNTNDLFNIIVSDTSQIKYIKGTIWNRWGGLIVEFTYPYNNGWDGTYNGNPCSEGVYFYIFEVKTTSNETFKYHGTVTLL